MKPIRFKVDLDSNGNNVKVERNTEETDVIVELTIGNTGTTGISTLLPFLNHLLQTFERHAGICLYVRADGDVDVDDHHLVEDVGRCMGRALLDLMYDERYSRFGEAIVPMDEALAICAVDFSGRPCFVWNAKFSDNEKIGGVTKENISHLFSSIVSEGLFNLHFIVSGTNDHHKAEVAMKAFAVAIKRAINEH